jgi:hypothetical protein
MSTRLDVHSRDTIARLIIKLAASGLLGAFGKLDYLPATATWIGLYAFFTSAFALVHQERFVREAFNHWDEALWLTFFALALMVLHRLWFQT